MSVFAFDSSAFVKLLVDEDGSDLVARIWDEATLVAASRLAYPEVRAALAAARRGSRLTVVAERRAVAEWNGYWDETELVELTPAIAASAGELAARHALGGADAVHLASALALGDVDPVLVSWDRRLWNGARAAGLGVSPGFEAPT